jgi:hypothetical protein
MFLELIAAIAAAFAAAGLALALNRLSGGRLPRWAMPAAAGAALLGYAVWSEYSWYGRVSGALPEGVRVTYANEARALWRPWTYLAPVVNRFVALDTDSIRRNPDVPHQRVADLYFYGRWSPRRGVQVVVDCREGRIAPLPTAEFDDAGAAVRAAWEAPLPGDRTLEAACD